MSINHHSLSRVVELETRTFLRERRLRNIVNEEAAAYLKERKCYAILEEENTRIEEINSQILNEISLGDIGHFALDVAGAVPGVGEAADLANAALYANKGQYFMAALSAISMVPAVGDVVGKGGKLATLLSKGGRVGEAVVSLKNMISKHLPKIKSSFSKLKRNKYIGKYIDDMLMAVNDFLKTPDDSKEAIQGVSQATKLASPIDAETVKKGKDALEKASPDKEKDIKYQKEK